MASFRCDNPGRRIISTDVTSPSHNRKTLHVVNHSPNASAASTDDRRRQSLHPSRPAPLTSMRYPLVASSTSVQTEDLATAQQHTSEVYPSSIFESRVITLTDDQSARHLGGLPPPLEIAALYGTRFHSDQPFHETTRALKRTANTTPAEPPMMPYLAAQAPWPPEILKELESCRGCQQGPIRETLATLERPCSSIHVNPVSLKHFVKATGLGDVGWPDRPVHSHYRSYRAGREIVQVKTEFVPMKPMPTPPATPQPSPRRNGKEPADAIVRENIHTARVGATEVAFGHPQSMPVKHRIKRKPVGGRTISETRLNAPLPPVPPEQECTLASSMTPVLSVPGSPVPVPAGMTLEQIWKENQNMKATIAQYESAERARKRREERN